MKILAKLRTFSSISLEIKESISQRLDSRARAFIGSASSLRNGSLSMVLAFWFLFFYGLWISLTILGCLFTKFAMKLITYILSLAVVHIPSVTRRRASLLAKAATVFEGNLADRKLKSNKLNIADFCPFRLNTDTV